MHDATLLEDDQRPTAQESSYGLLAMLFGALLLVGGAIRLAGLPGMLAVLSSGTGLSGVPPLTVTFHLLSALVAAGGVVIGWGLLRFFPWARRWAVLLVGANMIFLLLGWCSASLSSHPGATVAYFIQRCPLPQLAEYLLMLLFLGAPVMRALREERGRSGWLAYRSTAMVQRLSPAITPLAWYVALVWLINAGWSAFGQLNILSTLAVPFHYGQWAILLPIIGGLAAGIFLLCRPRANRVPIVLLYVLLVGVAPSLPMIGHWKSSLTSMGQHPLSQWGWACAILATPLIMGYFLLRDEGVMRAREAHDPGAGRDD